jgi:serine protease Do
MKRQLTLGIIGWLLATIGGYKAVAQEGKKEKKETQEIVIRTKGDKDTKMTVEITGDKVLINGKPLAEFNEDGITINNRKMIVRDGDKYILDLDGKKMDLDLKLKELKELQNLKGFSFNWNDDDMNMGEGKEYTFMGVSTENAEGGAKINSVTKESPAEKAGLKKDDIIYKIDDKEITGPSDLSETIRAMKKGDKVKVYFLRDGKKKDEKVVLGSQKSSFARTFTYSMPNGKIKSFSIPRTPGAPTAPQIYNDNGMFDGNDFHVFTSRQKLGLKIRDTEESNGVTILEVEPNSAAATAGLIKDDVITEIGGAKVTTTDEAREQLHDNADKNTYTIKAKRNGTEMTFTVKIPKNLKTANL